MKLSGTELKKIRKSLNLNQKDLANLLESSQAYVSQLETEFAGKDLPDGVKAVFLPYLVHNHPETYDQIVENQAYIISNISKHSEANEPEMNYQTNTSLAPTNGNKYAKPYYALDVFGTPGSEIVDQNEEYVMPAYYISIPELKDVDIYIRVTGDSMYPKYRHGDIIGIKKLNNSLFFAWYEPYVVVTRGNYQRLLKYIHPCKEDANSLLLVSYDSTRFDPQPINKEDIYSIWQVLGRVEF